MTDSFQDEFSLSILEDMKRELKRALTWKENVQFDIGYEVSNSERTQKVYEHFLEERRNLYKFLRRGYGLSYILVTYEELKKQQAYEKEGIPYTYVRNCCGCQLSVKK